MALTELKIKSLKPKAKPYKLADAGGLCIEVTPAGGKLWRWRYRYNGKEQSLALGRYPALGLADARRKRDEARELVNQGKHATREKKAQKLRQMAEGENTFEVVCKRWLEMKSRQLNAKYAKQTLARMKDHVFPLIGALPITEITIPEVVRVVENIGHKHGTVETARRLKQVISQTFRYAAQRGLCQHNPAADLRDLLPSKAGKHHACIAPAELPDLLKAMEAYQGDKMTYAAIHLLALTFVRTGELIIAGFEDIERFYEQHGHLPAHGEGKDIFERLYAVRLDKICTSPECRAALEGLDKHGILGMQPAATTDALEELDDDEILAELGVLGRDDNDITKLKHVRTRAEIKAAEEIAQRNLCPDFETFKPLFEQVREELKTGIRQSRRFKKDAQIRQGEFFILGGQTVYVADIGEEIKAPNGATDARLRVVYDNGTESDLLMRSLQRALYKDEAGRRITEPSAGPLFSDEAEDGDLESGTIYVLRSNSEFPFIKENREIVHKIGVAGGDVNKRIANTKLDPTFLMADVEVVATYKLSNINRTKLENLIHRFFEPAKLQVQIPDRFGNSIVPREWFLVPLFIIDEAVSMIKKETIVGFVYNPKSGTIEKAK